MFAQTGKRFLKNEDGAIAAVYALALPALIAVGGIAFDYTRMAAMDTELQNAADQSALAAASQLDGQDGAVARATNAASALVANNTVFSNDGKGSGVTIATVTFYEDRDGGTEVDLDDPDDPDDSYDTDADANANYVEVTVGARSAVYALTPIVDAFPSGDMDATAMAGVSTSICNVPPLYMAFDGGSEGAFLTRLVAGTGVELLNEEGSSLFGYLDQGAGGADLKAALAWDNQKGECRGITTVTPKPGVVASVEKGFNTRFATAGGGACPKDGPDTVACSLAVNTTAYPEDTCHATSTIVSPCTDKIGNGVWAGQTGSKSRYQTYKDAIGSSYAIGTDRRRLTIALIPYGSFGSSSATTPTQWMDVFIVKPMYGSGSKMRMYVEIIGVSSPAISGRRDVPYIIE